VPLAFASSSYKPWQPIVHAKENFIRSFCKTHHNIPPHLGLYSDDIHRLLNFIPTTVGAMNLLAPPLVYVVADRSGFMATVAPTATCSSTPPGMMTTTASSLYVIH
jgi:hypothetical protein